MGGTQIGINVSVVGLFLIELALRQVVSYAIPYAMSVAAYTISLRIKFSNIRYSPTANRVASYAMTLRIAPCSIPVPHRGHALSSYRSPNRYV
eukprot:725786-Rhodomonas_salina.1